MGSGVGGSTERIQLPGWVGALTAVEHWERPYTRGGGGCQKGPLGCQGPLRASCIACLHPVTPMDCGGSSGSGTWSRSGPPKKEELVGGKKKGRTWGPSSTLQKERAGGEERYG